MEFNFKECSLIKLIQETLNTTICDGIRMNSKQLQPNYTTIYLCVTKQINGEKNYQEIENEGEY